MENIKLSNDVNKTQHFTTKSNGQKDILDKFYTNADIAKQCINFIDNFSTYDCIIEPSAGNGSFSSQINNCKAYDLAPEAENIIQADWLNLDKTIFNSYNNILVIGNPPFGQQNNLAIEFFNESAKFANTIAFILPLSFKKESVQMRLNNLFHLRKEYILNTNSFTLNGIAYNVPCVFQIWDKTNEARQIKTNMVKNCPFIFTNKANADFRIQRVGGNAGKASLDLNRSEQSNYFVKMIDNSITVEDMIIKINNTIFPSINYTVGPKSLSKSELLNTLFN